MGQLEATRCPWCLKKFGKVVILQLHEKQGCRMHPDKKKERGTQVVGNGFGLCDSCETPLFIKGGMAGTGLCGPCCTGESETLNEMGDTW